MDAQAIITISAAVVALTQLVKWGGVPDKYGPLAVLLLAALGVAAWAYSANVIFERSQTFVYFAGWIAVATSSAGVFGFTRAGSEQLVKMKPPPGGGAGASPTIKD